MDKRMLLQMTADIVSAHASMNELSQEDLLAEIGRVHNRLSALGEGMEVEEMEAPADAAGVADPSKPAVPVDLYNGSLRPVQSRDR